MGRAMRTSGRGREGQKYALTSDEDAADFWRFAHEADGLFAPLPEEEGARRVHLAGCLPQGRLLKSLDHVDSRRAVAGNAWMDLLDARGATMGPTSSTRSPLSTSSPPPGEPTWSTSR